MDRPTKLLIAQLSFAALMAGVALGGMIEHTNSGVSRGQFDECVSVAEKCIGYLTECRSEPR